MSFKNYYAGDCEGCGAWVAKGVGVYYYGRLFCSEPKDDKNPLTPAWQGGDTVCAVEFEKRMAHYATPEFQNAVAVREAEGAAQNEMIRIKNVTECIPNAFVKLNMRPATLVKIVAKIVGAEVELAELTLQQSNLVWGEMQKRMQAKESSKQLDYWKANNLCPRCGGAGQADKWIATGKICFRCEGSGKYFG